MLVLLIGGGGREHALAWKLKQSPLVDRIVCAPGNAGLAELCELRPTAVDDLPGLAALAEELRPDLVLVGPELPLVLGLADRLRERGFAVFGPSARAARIEGSKVFAKEFMVRHGLPTAAYAAFTDFEAARASLRSAVFPLVVKADGLAAGKGVIICRDLPEAEAALTLIMREGSFGQAGAPVVIEEFLVGEEASMLAMTDGQTVWPMPSTQDHKTIFDGDQGPNTGGMGAYSPAPVVTPQLADEILETIMKPAVAGLAAEGSPFCGILYAGLMITKDGPRLLEFNARFGDPEAQPLLLRLESDLFEACLAAASGRLAETPLAWREEAAACVVMSAPGYPGPYEKGARIEGLAAAAAEPGVVVFHAGTAGGADRGLFLTNGGRVLGVSALAPTLREALERAYRAAGRITWPGVHFRRDIGLKALRREESAGPKPVVGLVMGSESDRPEMTGAVELLAKFGVPCELIVSSAHRSPARTMEYAQTARSRGLKVLIAGAGWAAHLAGVMAAETTLPVIGVPLPSSPLNGLDSLLATVQMPPGVPVATMALGAGGAKNAAVLATQILALSDAGLAQKLADYKEELARSVGAPKGR